MRGFLKPGMFYVPENMSCGSKHNKRYDSTGLLSDK
jgi:hypothetical protein